MKNDLNISLQNIHKVGIALMLFACLLDMPYGYYQLVRWVVAVSFAYWAYVAYEAKQIPVMILCIGIVILFQPIAKVALGRDVWNLVDVLLGSSILLSLVIDRIKIHEKF